MKKIVTIAAVAALATLAACSKTEAPEALQTNEAVATDNATEASAEKTGGPCGDGTVLRENEKCR